MDDSEIKIDSNDLNKGPQKVLQQNQQSDPQLASLAAQNTSLSFSNQNVDTTALPSLSSIALTPLAPQYRGVNLKVSCAVYVLIMSVGLIAYFQPFFELNEGLVLLAPWFAVGITGLTILDLLYTWFADPIKQYALREHDVHYQSGLFFRRLVTQPILRIQHIEIKRGPIQRLTDMASLQVFSAGGGAHTFEIPGLLADDAIKLRSFILAHKTSLEAS